MNERYYKFKGVNGEDRLIKLENGVTSSFIGGRWMIEPSLITKLNGRDPDDTVVEIDENEARKIAGVEEGSKFLRKSAFIIPLILLCLLGGTLYYVFVINKNTVSSETLEERIASKIRIGSDEKEIEYKDVEELYNLIPFSPLSMKNAYSNDITTISNVDASSLLTIALSYCLENDCPYQRNVYDREFNVSTLQNTIKELFNNHFEASITDKLVSLDNKYTCVIDDSRTIYNCTKEDAFSKTYREKMIYKITTNENDDLFIYEVSVLVKDKFEMNGEYHYSVYSRNNGVNAIKGCSSDSCPLENNVIELYGKNGTIYKHIFKLDSNKKYYWYSTILNNNM